MEWQGVQTVSATFVAWGVEGIGVEIDRKRYRRLIAPLSASKETFATLSLERQAAEQKLRDLIRLQARQGTYSRVGAAMVDTMYPIDRMTGAPLYDSGRTTARMSPGASNVKVDRLGRGLGLAGKVATVAGVGVGAWEVLSAPEEARAFVTMRTSGRVVGTIGGTMGTAAALGSAPGMLLLLGMTPGGGVVLIIIIILGGWVMGELGQTLGEKVYFIFAEPEDTFFERLPGWR